MSSAPDGLHDAGAALWAAVGEYLDAEDLDLDGHERAVLAEACRTADRLDAIRGALDGADLADPNAVKLLAEERMQRRLLADLLMVRLGFPSGLVEHRAEVKSASSTSRRAAAAAQARWGRRRGASA